MPQGSLLQGPSFLPVPSALVTFRTAGGAFHLRFAGWFGVVCDSSPLLTVCFRPEAGERELLRAGDLFDVSLPGDELLQELTAGSWTGGESNPAATRLPSLTVIPGEAEERDPLLAACPVRIECRCRSLAVRFGQCRLSGEVLAVHIDGQRQEVAAPIDFCRLLSLYGRRFHRNCEWLQGTAES